MSNFPRAKVIVSKCLGFAHCRYNGQTIPDRIVEKLGGYVEYRPVCPEVEIGLGIPRDPVRIVEQAGRRILYQPSTGMDASEDMEKFVDGFIRSVGAVDGFILKNRSPSCGPWDVKVYGGMGKDAGVRRGGGFFGGEVVDRFPGKPVEDEGRLNNFSVREHFLTRLFALTRFQLVKAQRSMGELADFHTRHKYLLMAYSQAQLKLLGSVVANHDKQDIDKVLGIYETHLEKALMKPPRYQSLINVLLHAYGGLAKNLKPQEIRFFLNSVEEYRDERIPLSVLIHLLEAWATGQGNRYLLEQALIRPYPLDLVEVTDSGKGRDY